MTSSESPYCPPSRDFYYDRFRPRTPTRFRNNSSQRRQGRRIEAQLRVPWIKSAPITNCATVPNTISDRAVEILNQIASKVATRASPTQSDANTHTFSTGNSSHLCS